MRFWDTSAIVPLLLQEASTRRATDLLQEDPEVVVWWGTATECVSAIARPERAGERVNEAFDRLDALAHAWAEIEASDMVRRNASRVLRTHALTAADALQLAAATVAAEGAPSSLRFVTFDRRLQAAAAREGFSVLGEAPRGAR